ncbi:Uncharacterized protein Zm00014a_042054 [Zea mays]|jgi:hypothetical protein|uniref:DUF538 family protein n=2 Tax=Zea mays TaxID=4577 RepID=B6SJ69_MAIZE|nr:hypothetical protein [Zea mays]ACG38958.1 hypothetical protein [Zea mays]ACG41545.1 hypothetical protein [Zea mays]PWZ11679.1 Uncharacterized protein Zm00014a_042054 [Zea mays]
MLAHRFLLLIAVAAAAASGIASAKPTAYEALADYDFPPGILPKGVVAYTVDNATGAFTATLDASASGAGSSICEFSIEGSYSLRYQTKITGKISPDHLTDLQGVSVKVLFFWLNIVEVTRHGDNLEFSVGIAAADFGIDNFLECPTCGCGFDCNDLLMLQKAGAATARLRLRGAF